MSLWQANFIKDNMLGLCDKPAARNSGKLPVIPVKLRTVKLIILSNFHPIMQSLVTIYVKLKFYNLLFLLNCKAF